MHDEEGELTSDAAREEERIIKQRMTCGERIVKQRHEALDF